MTKFQLIIFGILGAFIIVAILIFAGVLPGLGGGGGGQQFANVKLLIWGVLPQQSLSGVLNEIQQETGMKIQYVQKSPPSYEQELIDALASGKGPDIWELPQDLVLKHQDKAFILPFELYSERQFKNTFAEESELYLKSEKGIIGIPLILDPMVLYWNRDLFSNAGVAESPSTWDEFLKSAQILTSIDASGNILQSGAALGEFSNVRHSKEIISFLILQTGNPIIEPKTLEVVLDKKQEGALPAAENAISFFTEFSNPRKVSYSWNRGLSQSDQVFVEGKLAMYFGYAGEYPSLKEKNPHLNFDVAQIPQIKDGKLKATFGKIHAFTVSQSSRNIQAAWTALSYLSSKDKLEKISEALFLPPARRDILSKKIKDPVLSVFYQTALQSRAWLEPEPEKTSEIFETMIESVVSGKKRTSQAVSDAARQLKALIK